MGLLKYNEIKTPEDCIFRISPSQIALFFEYPSVWYKQEVCGVKEFDGNTATMIGTVCHLIYEYMAKGLPIDREMIANELEAYRDHPEIDVDEVINTYPSVANTVLSQYLQKNRPTEVELPVLTEVSNGIYVGGTCDNLTGDIVVDYKNVKTKPTEGAGIPFKYKIQLLAYAYALRANNKLVDRIRIVYGVQPTKTLDARCLVVTEQISYEDWKLIEDTLELMVLTVLEAKENPKLIPLLFKSMKLKPEYGVL